MLAGAVPDEALRLIHGESAEAIQFNVPVPALVTVKVWPGGFTELSAKNVSDEG